MPTLNSLQTIKLTAVTAANSQAFLPPNCMLESVTFFNTTANAVTGGIDMGTTNGGTDILSATAVGANGKVVVSGSQLSKQLFSETAFQQIFFTAHTGWNSAALDVSYNYIQL